MTLQWPHLRPQSCTAKNPTPEDHSSTIAKGGQRVYLGFRVQGLLGDLWLEGIGEVRSFGVYIRGVWAGLLNSG